MNYTIEGEPLPVVICNLDANETMITEKGAMSWMTPNMNMETTSNGGIGKMFGRAFSGESMFQNRYTAMGGPGMIAFASGIPDWTGTGDSCTKISISRFYSGCRAFYFLPEALRLWFIWRRRFYYAASFRKWTCVSGV